MKLRDKGGWLQFALPVLKALGSFGSLVSGIKSFSGAVGSGIYRYAQPIVQAGRNLGESVIQGVGSTIGKVIDNPIGALGGIASTVGSIGSAIGNGAQAIGNSKLMQGVGSLAGSIGGIADSLGGLAGYPMQGPNGQQVSGAPGQPDRDTDVMMKTYQRAKYGNEIFRLIAPIQYAQRQGRADRAYRQAAFPGTQSFDWLGTQGISGGMSAADITSAGNVASSGISTGPQWKEQERRDKMLDEQMKKLNQENQLLAVEVIKRGHESNTELERSKAAAAIFAVQGDPNNWIRVAYDLADWFKNRTGSTEERPAGLNPAHVRTGAHVVGTAVKKSWSDAGQQLKDAGKEAVMSTQEAFRVVITAIKEAKDEMTLEKIINGLKGADKQPEQKAPSR